MCGLVGWLVAAAVAVAAAASAFCLLSLPLPAAADAADDDDDNIKNAGETAEIEATSANTRANSTVPNLTCATWCLEKGSILSLFRDTKWRRSGSELLNLRVCSHLSPQFRRFRLHF